jgi:hypothetical protein
VVAGVTEVVEVDAVQAGGSERRCPGGAAEVAVPEQLAPRRSEDERGGARSCVGDEVVVDLSDDGAGQDDATPAGGGFRRREDGAWPRASVS